MISSNGIQLPFTNFSPSSAESLTAFGAANTEQVVKFICNQNITLGHVAFFLGTGVAAALMGIALYDATGLVKLSAADAVSVAGSTTVLRPALSTVINLLQDTAYWLGWTCTSNAVTISNFLMGATPAGWGGIYNAGAIRSGTSGTATAGGVTNANIGVVTGAQLRIPDFTFD